MPAKKKTIKKKKTARSAFSDFLTVQPGDHLFIEMLCVEAQRQCKLARTFKKKGNPKAELLSQQLAWAYGISAVWLRSRNDEAYIEKDIETIKTKGKQYRMDIVLSG